MVQMAVLNIFSFFTFLFLLTSSFTLNTSKNLEKLRKYFILPSEPCINNYIENSGFESNIRKNEKKEEELLRSFFAEAN